jgi:pimeloyl-ACP methyl ester carboxylesterase
VQGLESATTGCSPGPATALGVGDSSNPVAPGALPTLEQWADSITAVLDDLGSREAVLLVFDGAFATAALFAATYPSRTTALVVLEGYADPLVRSRVQHVRGEWHD